MKSEIYIKVPAIDSGMRLWGLDLKSSWGGMSVFSLLSILGRADFCLARVACWVWGLRKNYEVKRKFRKRKFVGFKGVRTGRVEKAVMGILLQSWA